MTTVSEAVTWLTEAHPSDEVVVKFEELVIDDAFETVEVASETTWRSRLVEPASVAFDIELRVSGIITLQADLHLEVLFSLPIPVYDRLKKHAAAAPTLFYIFERLIGVSSEWKRRHDDRVRWWIHGSQLWNIPDAVAVAAFKHGLEGEEAFDSLVDANRFGLMADIAEAVPTVRAWLPRCECRERWHSSLKPDEIWRARVALPLAWFNVEALPLQDQVRFAMWNYTIRGKSGSALLNAASSRVASYGCRTNVAYALCERRLLLALICAVSDGYLWTPDPAPLPTHWFGAFLYRKKTVRDWMMRDIEQRAIREEHRRFFRMAARLPREAQVAIVNHLIPYRKPESYPVIPTATGPIELAWIAHTSRE